MVDVVSRLEQARAEIARRRQLAEVVLPDEAWPEERVRDRLEGRLSSVDAAFVATSDPVHVLAVLAAADATLDRHAHYEAEGTCDHCAGSREWPCPDAAAVLDLYAPEVTSG